MGKPCPLCSSCLRSNMLLPLLVRIVWSLTVICKDAHCLYCVQHLEGTLRLGLPALVGKNSPCYCFTIISSVLPRNLVGLWNKISCFTFLLFQVLNHNNFFGTIFQFTKLFFFNYRNSNSFHLEFRKANYNALLS